MTRLSIAGIVELICEGDGIFSCSTKREHFAGQICSSYAFAADEPERQILDFEARNHFLRAVSLR